jgi:uridine kinase
VTAWDGAPRPAAVVPAGSTVILEGVTASREAFRPYLAFAIWIETPRDECLRRGIERDGEHMREQWERWFASEDPYVAREDPRGHADAIVPGV